MSLQKSSFLILLFLCASCRMLPPKEQNISKNITPEKFSSISTAPLQQTFWWKDFRSKELNNLISIVLENNTTITQASARLKQSKAIATQYGASRHPSLSASAGASTTHSDQTLNSERDKQTESAEIGLSASYELDLWGRISSEVKGAVLNMEATREDLDSVRISVTAETALRYFELLNVRQKLDLIEDQLKTSNKIKDLIETRYKKSQATALDVLQQRENIASIEVLSPPLLAREQLLLNQITVLAGKSIGADLNLHARKLPSVPFAPGTGIPAELLEHRPDIRAAQKRLEASQWKVKSAKADRLPSLSITASAGYSSTDISNLLDQWIANLAANLVGPIIDGGRRKAEVERTRAVTEEHLASYKGIVLNAIRDVEDALVLEQRQIEHLAALERQQKAAEMAFQEAATRYKKGADSYLYALTALTRTQQLQRQYTDSSLNRIIYRIYLYRGLAGSWHEEDGKDKQ